jgi:hypothetical protein
MLDSPDDSVRYWVATALGNLGPTAKAAVPKLQEMLPKADCINGAITSASGIRYAQIKMGIKPPPPLIPTWQVWTGSRGRFGMNRSIARTALTI